MSREYYQIASIRRHIQQATERAKADPVPVRTVPAGQVKQYMLERLLGVRYRNGGFV